jgi:hypothetical protein
MKNFIEITNGPSKEELFDGLRLHAEKRLVPFCIEKDKKEKYVAVIINFIQAEDGSGHSWNLMFYINKHFVSELFFIDKPEKKETGVVAKKVNFDFFRQLTDENYLTGKCREELITVKAHYSTKTRKGVITVDE